MVHYKTVLVTFLVTCNDLEINNGYGDGGWDANSCEAQTQ